MKLTSPAPAPIKNPPRCPACRTILVTVDPDERDAYGLPPVVCKCSTARLVAEFIAEGWGKVSPDEQRLLNDAKLRSRHYLGEYAARAPDAGGSYILFARYVPTWARAVLDNFALPGATKVLCLRRAARDPEVAAAAATTYRLSGSRAVVPLLLRDLVPTGHAPQDQPDAPAPDTDDDNGRVVF